MIKQIFIAATAACAFTFMASPAQAEEVDCTITPEAAICLDQAESGIMPINETNETMPINDIDDNVPVRDHDYPEANQTDSQPDNSQVEVIEDTEIIEEESEPALWPMYLSLGALGLALLVFIVLNLFGGKKRK